MENTDFNKMPTEGQDDLNEFTLALLGTISDSFSSWQENAKKNREMLELNYSHIGKIIHYHLVLENLINDELNLHYNYEKELLSESRLQFYQKVKMLPTKGKLYRIVIPGIEQLNYIRNKIAHNLDYDISRCKTNYIDALLPMMGVVDPSAVSIEKRIEEFTNLCIMFFSMNSKEIKSHWNSLYEKYPSVEEKFKSFFNKTDM